MSHKNRILLFSPGAWSASEEELWMGRGHSYTSAMGVPLGLLAVATFVEREGYDIRIVSGSEADYLTKIAECIGEETLCVGISAMTGSQIARGIQVAQAVRAQDETIPIVWGGYHPSIMPEQTAQSPHVDFVVRGYGERTFLELVLAIEHGRPPQDVMGLTFMNGNEVVTTPDRPIEDLSTFPPVPYHLVDVETFLTAVPELGKRSLGYISSRGCPNNCSFCADRLVYKRRWNALGADRILDDLSALKERYGIDSIRFYDSNFFVNEKRVIAFCKGMIERNLQLPWGHVNGSTEVLVNYSEETWDLMGKAQCRSILVGAESGYSQALTRLQKRATVEDLERLALLAGKHNVVLMYSFMFGIPIDLTDYEQRRTHFRKELAGTLSLITRLVTNNSAPLQILTFRFTLYPGSSLYEECKKFGWTEPDSLEEWSENTLGNASQPWLTEEEVSIIDSIIALMGKGIMKPA